VWDYAAGMELMRCFWNAAKALEPAAAALDEAVRFPGCTPAPLEALFKAMGLPGVATRAIDVHTRFRDFDDYWSPFLAGQGPAPAYVVARGPARGAARSDPRVPADCVRRVDPARRPCMGGARDQGGRHGTAVRGSSGS
jgi:hypothetical protein